MNGFPTRQQVDRTKEKYPAGTKIRMEPMSDSYAPIPPGIEGTVDFVDDIGTLHCTFENGRNIGVIVGEDGFSVIEPEEEQGMGLAMKQEKRQDAKHPAVPLFFKSFYQVKNKNSFILRLFA